MKQMVFVVGGEASCGGAEDSVVDGVQGEAEGDEGGGGAEVVIGVGNKDGYIRIQVLLRCHACMT